MLVDGEIVAPVSSISIYGRSIQRCFGVTPAAVTKKTPAFSDLIYTLELNRSALDQCFHGRDSISEAREIINPTETDPLSILSTDRSTLKNHKNISINQNNIGQANVKVFQDIQGDEFNQYQRESSNSLGLGRTHTEIKLKTRTAAM